MHQVRYGGVENDFKQMASAEQVRAFLETPVWLDMRNFIEQQVQEITRDLIMEDNPGKIRELQYEIRSKQMFLDLPNQLIVWSEEDQKERGKDDAGTEESDGRR